jgi:hypothetical protein
MITAVKKDILGHLLELHDPVSKWVIDTGTDSTGEDAVWVWAIVDDETLSSLSQDDRARLRDRVREAVQRAEVGRESTVYVRFRGTSEV